MKNQEMIQNITEKFVNQFSPSQIYLFGSNVWGNPNDDSDLDFLILIDEEKFSQAEKASQAFKSVREIETISMDVLVNSKKYFDKFSSIKTSLMFKIQNEGILLYDRSL